MAGPLFVLASRPADFRARASIELSKISLCPSLQRESLASHRRRGCRMPGGKIRQQESASLV
jgi:hypothetical protein